MKRIPSHHVGHREYVNNVPAMRYPLYNANITAVPIYNMKEYFQYYQTDFIVIKTKNIASN